MYRIMSTHIHMYHLSVCLSVSLSLSLCLSVCLSVCRSVCLFVCLSLCVHARIMNVGQFYLFYLADVCLCECMHVSGAKVGSLTHEFCL